jgi:hypothetical protein
MCVRVEGTHQYQSIALQQTTDAAAACIDASTRHVCDAAAEDSLTTPDAVDAFALVAALEVEDISKPC